jgi:U3 small nucleolar RNA-associated protein 21
MPKRAPKRFKAQTEDEKAAAADQAGPSTSKPSPRLFHPFRALGFVCDHVPMSIFTHSAKGALSVPHVNIVTSVGRSWMMWEAGRMGLVFVGTSALLDYHPKGERGTNG